MMGWYGYIDEYDDMQYEFYSNKVKALRENYYEPLVRLKGEDFSIAESELTTSNNEGEYFDAYVDGISKIFTSIDTTLKKYDNFLCDLGHCIAQAAYLAAGYERSRHRIGWQDDNTDRS